MFVDPKKLYFTGGNSLVTFLITGAGIWERAECVHNPLGGKIQLNFIDSGRCEFIWNTEIRPIAPEFAIYPMPVNITIVSSE